MCPPSSSETAMPPTNPEDFKGELIDLLLAVEQEVKSHTARMLSFEEQIRALLGELLHHRKRRVKTREWTTSSGKKRIVKYEE